MDEYTLEKYTLDKYTLEKYTLEKSPLESTLWDNQTPPITVTQMQLNPTCTRPKFLQDTDIQTIRQSRKEIKHKKQTNKQTRLKTYKKNNTFCTMCLSWVSWFVYIFQIETKYLIGTWAGFEWVIKLQLNWQNTGFIF